MDLVSRTLMMGAAGSRNYWISTLTGSGTENAQRIQVDSDGFPCIIGYTTSQGGGGYDLFLAKYNRDGVVQWQRVLGGAGTDAGYDIAIDSNDNIYVIGYTESQGAGGAEFLLVKYDTDGVLQWQRSLGSSGIELGYGLALDSSANIYITGYTTSQGAGGYDAVIAKYNSSGVIQWQRSLGGASTDIGYSVAVDSGSNVYVVGYQYSQTYGQSELLLAKYNSSGTIQWQRGLGSAGYEFGHGIIVDPFDDIYVTGGTTSQGAGDYDVLINKYSSGGGIYWQRSLGGAGTDYSYGVGVDAASNVYVAAFTTSQGSGSNDCLIAKYNFNGVIQWQRLLGGTTDDAAYGICVDKYQDIYICGASAGHILVAKVPGNGGMTGTYGSYVYQAATLTDAATTINFYASTLTDAATTLTDAARTLTDSASTLTASRTSL